MKGKVYEMIKEQNELKDLLSDDYFDFEEGSSKCIIDGMESSIRERQLSKLSSIQNDLSKLVTIVEFLKEGVQYGFVITNDAWYTLEYIYRAAEAFNGKNLYVSVRFEEYGEWSEYQNAYDMATATKEFYEEEFYKRSESLLDNYNKIKDDYNTVRNEFKKILTSLEKASLEELPEEEKAEIRDLTKQINPLLHDENDELEDSLRMNDLDDMP